MENAPGEDAVETVETATYGLESYINLVDTAVAGLDRIDSNSGRSPPVDRMLSNSITCFREISHERKSRSMPQTSVLSYFKKLRQPPQPSLATPLLSQLPSAWRQEPPPAKTR